MKSIILLFLICFIAVTSVNAQSNNTFSFETGIAIHRVQDLGHSPLIYKGQAIFLGANYSREKEKTISTFHLSTANDELVPPESSEDYGLNIGNRQLVQGSYSYLKKTQRDKLQIAYGGSFAVLYDFIAFNHSANNLVGYELNLSLNPTLLLSYDLHEKIDVSLSGSIPLVNYSIRPNALGLFPMDDFEAELISILTGGSLVTINDIFSLHSRISARFTINNWHPSLFYDYFGGVNKVVEKKGFALHKIGIQVPLKINWK